VLTIRSRRSDGGTIEVSVTDTGIGIDPADRERVFQSLFTTKASGTISLFIEAQPQFEKFEYSGERGRPPEIS